MSKVTKLTAAQEAKFPAYVAQWKAIGLSTEMADRPRAEAAIRLMYANAKLAEPRIVWTQSPLGNALALQVLSDKHVRASVRDSVGDSVRASVRDSVGDSVGDSVWASVRDSVWASVRDSVGDSVRDSVWASVGASVGDSVRDSVGDSVRDSVWDSIGASVWASIGASVWASVRDSVGDSVRDSVGDSVRDSVGDSVRDSVGDSVWASVRDSVWASVGDSVRDSVGDSVWASVGDSVRDSVGDSVRDSVWDSIGASVWASIGASVWASVRDSVGDSVRDSVGDSVYGSHDAPWLAFYRFFRDECGLVDQTAALAGLWELSQSAGWALPYKHVCFVSDRHDVCKLDENGRLHCENGPAVRYRDGFAIYAWHGTRLPAEWVEQRNTIHPAEILKAENVEQRAAGAAMLGWPRMISHLKRRIIDGDPDSDLGALVELTLPGLREPGRFLQAKCPRNGIIVEGVPRQSDIDGLPINTVIAAQAWRIGDPQSEYTHPPRRT